MRKVVKIIESETFARYTLSVAAGSTVLFLKQQLQVRPDRPARSPV